MSCHKPRWQEAHCPSLSFSCSPFLPRSPFIGNSKHEVLTSSKSEKEVNVTNLHPAFVIMTGRRRGHRRSQHTWNSSGPRISRSLPFSPSFSHTFSLACCRHYCKESVFSSSKSMGQRHVTHLCMQVEITNNSEIFSSSNSLPLPLSFHKMFLVPK